MSEISNAADNHVLFQVQPFRRDLKSEGRINHSVFFQLNPGWDCLRKAFLPIVSILTLGIACERFGTGVSRKSNVFVNPHVCVVWVCFSFIHFSRKPIQKSSRSSIWPCPVSEDDDDAPNAQLTVTNIAIVLKESIDLTDLHTVVSRRSVGPGSTDKTRLALGF